MNRPLAAEDRSPVVVSRRTAWLLAIALTVYLVGLIVALRYGSDDVRVAVIAVGGAAVGAVAGVIGSIVGSRIQAVASSDATRLQTTAALEQKKVELDALGAEQAAERQAQRDRLLLQEQLQWATEAYSQLGKLLGASRKLVIDAASYSAHDAIDREVQEIATHCDLLRANPILAADEAIEERLEHYPQAVSESAEQVWRAARGAAPGEQHLDTRHPGTLGEELAASVGACIRQVVTSVLTGVDRDRVQ